ncbi:uncharacterized protein LOC125955485 [Anopheles darlingi]|uniref:uncharacterized protein LOC125955485 n=1 Tax=Anopheles darlingi TaxID=43151 RepID=UPI0021004199|nr:uncharacterized protein LOC125955485 [Anopheles darlingi]
MVWKFSTFFNFFGEFRAFCDKDKGAKREFKSFATPAVVPVGKVDGGSGKLRPDPRNETIKEDEAESTKRIYSSLFLKGSFYKIRFIQSTTGKSLASIRLEHTATRALAIKIADNRYQRITSICWM